MTVIRKSNKSMRHTLVLAAALMFPMMSGADDQDVVDYRGHLMRGIQEQSAALGLMLSQAIPPDNAAAHLEAISLTAASAVKAFAPKVPGGEAKPEVWSNWADFSRRMNEFAQKTAQAARTTKEKGIDAAVLLDALDCKSCHDIYRAEKKK